MLVWPLADQTGVKSQLAQSLITETELFAFLESRRGKLDGVVISGGEPTLHQDLPEFIKKIKDLGFEVKLDTNGTNPEMLDRLITDQLVDYVAMDIKAPWDKYHEVVGVKLDYEKLKKSVIILSESQVPYEMRSTIAPHWHNEADIVAMASQIAEDALWYLQKFLGDRDLVNQSYVNARSFTDSEMEAMLSLAQKHRSNTKLR